MNQKRITVDLDPGLFERLRKAAFDQHESMSVIVRASLTAALPPEKAGDDDSNE